MVKDQHVIVIAGPTGVGKTDTALEIARTLPVEIINADIGQFYQPLTIGTAKPNWQESDIPHHLFDIIDKPVSLTVTDYRKKVYDLCCDIWKRNKMPLIVGGSHFYISSLFFPPQADDSIQHHSYENYSTQELWDELNTIDSKRAEEIHPNDRYRLERALDIWHSTGTQPSQHKPLYNPIASSYTIIFLTRDRQNLYKRIDTRTTQMIQQGWIEEVKPLLATEWESFLHEKKIIGYDDIISFLHSTKNINQTKYDQLYDQLQKQIAQKTRNYAKRQITYWKMLENKLFEYNNKNQIKTINFDHETTQSFTQKLAGFLSALYTDQLKKEHNGR